MSTLQSPERSYHHGDLRSALIEAGMAALEAAEADALSLRQLAREVGVSATAVYRHFPDKQALMKALAAEGIERLGRYQQSAAEHSGAAAFAETGRAYVRFATAHPALFRLIFSQGEPASAPIFGDNLAAQLLHDAAARAVGGDPAETERRMVQAWAVVHGLAMLMLDRQLPTSDDLIDRVIDPATLFGGSAT